jgi:hypothetical protein
MVSLASDPSEPATIARVHRRGRRGKPANREPLFEPEPVVRLAGEFGSRTRFSLQGRCASRQVLPEPSPMVLVARKGEIWTTTDWAGVLLFSRDFVRAEPRKEKPPGANPLIEPEAAVRPTGELDERPRFFREAQDQANAGADGFGYFRRNESTPSCGGGTPLSCRTSEPPSAFHQVLPEPIFDGSGRRLATETQNSPYNPRSRPPGQKCKT